MGNNNCPSSEVELEQRLIEESGILLETLLTICCKIKDPRTKTSQDDISKIIDHTINYITECHGSKISSECSNIVKKLSVFSQGSPSLDKMKKLQTVCEAIDLITKLIVSTFQAHQDLIIDMISKIKSFIMPNILNKIRCSEKNRKENPNAVNQIIECLLIEYTEYKNLNMSQSRKDLVMKCVYALCLINYAVCALARQKLKITSLDKCLEHYQKVMSNHGDLIMSAAVNAIKILISEDFKKCNDEKPILESLQAVLVCVANTAVVTSLCHCRPDISALVTYALNSVTDENYEAIEKVLGPRPKHYTLKPNKSSR